MRLALLILLACPGCLLAESAAPKVDASKPAAMVGDSRPEANAANNGVGKLAVENPRVKAIGSDVDSRAGGDSVTTINGSGQTYAVIGAGLLMGLAMLIVFARALGGLRRDFSDHGDRVAQSSEHVAVALTRIADALPGVCKARCGGWPNEYNGARRPDDSGHVPVSRQHSVGAQV